MNIIDFTSEWIPQAQSLLQESWAEERSHVPALPEHTQPDLASLAQRGLAVAAVEDGRLLGYLGAYGPWQPVFCTPDVSGVFSPLHAHAVQKENRVRIWQRLYQAAAEKWVAAGAVSHAVTLFAHDREGQEALYLYGFGVRCIDLIRPMEHLTAPAWRCRELAAQEQSVLTPLRRLLAEHLAQSPCFMVDPPEQVEAWLQRRLAQPPRTFVAEADGQIAAYMEVTSEGENYLSDTPGTMNICGAYCLPEHRGTGAAQAVLAYMIAALRAEGFTRLGVDCESFNPTALGFWRKYFTPYTHSVVRRIDENARNSTF